MKFDKDRLQEEGFIRLPGLIDAQMLQEFEQTMDQLGRSGLDRMGMEQSSNDAMADLLRKGGEFRVLLFTNLKHLWIVQKMGQHISRELDEAGFFDWAEFIAPIAYPTVRADVPFEAKYLLPMHQDIGTPCQKAWRVWVTLRDANAQTGTLRVAPGSHHQGYIEHDASDPKSPHVPETHYDVNTLETLDFKAGDAILFDPLLVHGSVGAKVDRMKYNLLMNLWDLTTVSDPEDPADPLSSRLNMRRERDKIRVAAA